MSDVHPPEAETSAVAYGSFVARFRALVLDAVILLATVLLLVFGASAVNSEGASRMAIIVVAAVLLLYEPVFVSRTGATPGHQRSNLHVVFERTGRAPPFWVAVVRFLVKSLLGLPSFVFMAVTRRHQALHDRVAGTTVRIRNVANARAHDVVSERSDAELAPPGMPSRARRIVVILAYLAASFVGLSFVSVVLVSDACIAADQCTAAENLRLQIGGLAWLAFIAFCVVAGWRGHLWGARRRAATSGAPEA